MPRRRYQFFGGILALLSLLGSTLCGRAQYTFITNANNTITITAGLGLAGNITIPSVTNGYPITEIGTNSIRLNPLLTSVTIPDSVLRIDTGAFASCSGLTNVVIGEGVTNVASAVFPGCTSLKNITVNATNSAYTNTGGVLFDIAMDTLVQYPEGLAGSYAIPNSVTSINPYAFATSSGLTDVTIPDSVTSIGTYAFETCSGLKNMAIASGVTNIGAGAFLLCSSLTNFTVDVANPAYTSTGGVVFNQNLTTLVEYPGGLAGSYAIPDGVNTIETNAFENCKSLTSVAIPDGVTNLEYQAFAFCSGLTNLTTGNGLTTIGDSTFWGCYRLPEVIIPGTVTSIGSAAFYGCSSLSNIVIPNGVTSISAILFSSSGLTNIIIPGSVTSIGANAFASCAGLQNVSIPNSVSSIGDYAFRSSGLSMITIPDSVTNIGTNCFGYCSSLTNALIGQAVASLGPSTFQGSTNLHQAYFLGNAPTVNGLLGTVDISVFMADTGKVYYVPGTTGWGATFGGWPTAGWFLPQPQILSSSQHMGVHENAFQFTISWATNTTVVVEASTNLQNWVALTTNALANGTNAFSDPLWTNLPQRFYRVRTP